MKCGVRFKLLVTIVCLTTVVILLAVLEDKAQTYDPLGYVQYSVPWLQRGGRERARPEPAGSTVEDKILVIPALEGIDMSWVAEELPDWQRAIYTVNPSNETMGKASALVTPMNKGHEAMAYLTYIIDNYETSIPAVVAFLHSHRNGFFEAWHVDTPLHDNVHAMRLLQLDFVKKNGYVNLRCNWNPGCKKQNRANVFTSEETWQDLLGETSTPYFNPRAGNPAALSDTSILDDGDPGFYMKMTVWTPCCAQFAVSKEQIYSRPLDDYVRIRNWLIVTEKNDRDSGRIMEYMWHVIFGMEAT